MPLRAKHLNTNRDLNAVALSSDSAAELRANLPWRAIGDWLSPLERIAAGSPRLVVESLGTFERQGRNYGIPRYTFSGPKAGADPIRIGIFAGIYGDEPEGVQALIHLVEVLEKYPDLAAGYSLRLYPVCNPTGLEVNTAFSSLGKDLHAEMLIASTEPEIQLLQSDLAAQPLEGFIRLHTNQTSEEFHGLVRGQTLAQQLLEPALNAAAELLPVDSHNRISFRARDMVFDHYARESKAATKSAVRPFEIVLETPGQAPLFSREWALVAALRAILLEYRKFIAYAPNL